MKKFILATPEELQDYIRLVLRQELAKQVTTNDHLEEPIDIDEASRFTKIPKSTIYQLTMRRSIPHGRNGKRLIFYRSQLLIWLQKKNRLTRDEIEEGLFTEQVSIMKGGVKC